MPKRGQLELKLPFKKGKGGPKNGLKEKKKDFPPLSPDQGRVVGKGYTFSEKSFEKREELTAQEKG